MFCNFEPRLSELNFIEFFIIVVFWCICFFWRRLRSLLGIEYLDGDQYRQIIQLKRDQLKGDYYYADIGSERFTGCLVNNFIYHGWAVRNLIVESKKITPVRSLVWAEEVTSSWWLKGIFCLVKLAYDDKNSLQTEWLWNYVIILFEWKIEYIYYSQNMTSKN